MSDGIRIVVEYSKQPPFSHADTSTRTPAPPRRPVVNRQRIIKMIRDSWVRRSKMRFLLNLTAPRSQRGVPPPASTPTRHFSGHPIRNDRNIGAQKLFCRANMAAEHDLWKVIKGSNASKSVSRRRIYLKAICDSF